MAHFKNLAYKALQILGIFSLVSYFYRKKPLILCYHGGSLGDEWVFNPKLFMRTQTFHSRVKILIDKGYSFIKLDDLLSKRIEDIPIKSICFTFDDGWQSTFTELIPVLFEKKIPSTLYLHTKNFVEQMPIHHVAIRYLIFTAKNSGAVKVSDFSWNEINYNFYVSKDVDRFIIDFEDQINSQGATKNIVHNSLKTISLKLDIPAKEANFIDGTFDYVSLEQIKKLVEMNCTVELHGHRHRYPSGSPEDFSMDLTSCRESILKSGLKNPNHYCYPSGNHDDAASKILSAHNIVSATTCIPGFIDKSALSSPHYLPRFLDGEDVSEIEFLAEISGLSDLLRKIRKFALNKT